MLLKSLLHKLKNREKFSFIPILLLILYLFYLIRSFLKERQITDLIKKLMHLSNSVVLDFKRM